MNMKPIKNKDRAFLAGIPTKEFGKLQGCTFAQLVKLFGKPVFDFSANPGAGGRRRLINTCYRWVLDYGGEPLCIFDWRNPSLDYVENNLTTWVVATSSLKIANDAIKEINEQAKKPSPKKRKAKKNLEEFENAPA